MITVYTKDGCPKCRALKLKMTQKGIEYTESQDITKLQDSGIMSLPVVEVDGELLTFEKAIKFVNERTA